MNSNSIQKNWILLPILFFLLEWALIIFLLESKFYSYYTIQPSTYAILLSGILSVTIGAIVFNRDGITIKNNSSSLIVDNLKTELNEGAIYKSLLVTLLLMLIGFFIVYKSVSEHFGSYTFYFENPILIRMYINDIIDGNVTDLGVLYKIGSYFNNLSPCASVFTGILFVRKKHFGFYVIPIFIFTSISALLSFSRYQFFTIAGFFILSAFFSSLTVDKERRSVALKKIGFAIVIVFVLIALVTFGIFRARTFNVSKYSDLFYKQLYFYFVGGVPSFNQFLLDNRELLWGQSTFRGILRWLGKFGISTAIDEYGVNHKFVKVGPGYSGNTYTFVKSFYHDFGTTGVVFFSFLWGSFYSYFGIKYLKKPSILLHFMLILLSFGLILSFFNLYLEGFTLFVLWIIYAVLIYSTFDKKIVFFSSIKNG